MYTHTHGGSILSLTPPPRHFSGRRSAVGPCCRATRLPHLPPQMTTPLPRETPRADTIQYWQWQYRVQAKATAGGDDGDGGEGSIGGSSHAAQRLGTRRYHRVGLTRRRCRRRKGGEYRRQ